MKRVYLLLIVAITVLAADGLVKFGIEQWLGVHDLVVPVVGESLRLTLVYNTGVALGMFGNGGGALLVLTGAIIVSLLIWSTYRVYETKTPALAYLPLGLILGGASANFIDRVIDGRVTDFLDFGYRMWRFPTFNLADCALVVGVSLFMILFWDRHKSEFTEMPLTADTYR